MLVVWICTGTQKGLTAFWLDAPLSIFDLLWFCFIDFKIRKMSIIPYIVMCFTVSFIKPEYKDE